MSREHSLPPSAACLSESLRDIGYSLETAIADLIDNSISANATAIKIFCEPTADEPLLIVADDGSGMSQEELIEAMRHGSADSRADRHPTDLGRFGLGLKTASFSQCRRLTVVSMQNSIKHAVEWNLDTVAARDKWIINILNDKEISSLPYTDQLTANGTLVLWRDLDRLTEDYKGEHRSEIVNAKLDAVGRHLSLVFHRFLSGDIKGRKAISITLNGDSIEPFDPFCKSNSATQMMPEETIRINKHAIKIQPYILPHHSKLTAKEYDFYQDRSDFMSNQGAYIYRNGRLMAWGDWFRLIAKGESTKLARVQIDFPNALDKDWTIDIKKSRAHPPHEVRERIRQILAKITDRSTIVHKGRGQRLYSDISEPVWNRFAKQGSIRYEINLDHPLLGVFFDALDKDLRRQFNFMLQTISVALPTETIYSDYCTSPTEMKNHDLDEDMLLEKLNALKTFLFQEGDFDGAIFEDVARSTRLFEHSKEMLTNFIRENCDGI